MTFGDEMVMLLRKVGLRGWRYPEMGLGRSTGVRSLVGHTTEVWLHPRGSRRHEKPQGCDMDHKEVGAEVGRPDEEAPAASKLGVSGIERGG